MAIQVDHTLTPKAPGGSQNINVKDLEHIPIKLPPLTTFCDDYHVSLPRLLKLIWSTVLKTYTGSNDVSFRCVFPPPAGHKQTWEEHVSYFEMVQDIPVMDLLKDDTQNWNREVRNHDIEGCDTLLFWKLGSAGVSSLYQEFDTSNVGAMALVCRG